ncbi:MAG: hypothetical protein BECKG1743D_GA0114223_102421 [Candidatus Kentron sp. G]|nr:MAG: hypothetical protein BECKG1743F_GA0114225_102511 [Candidatus Kentron sp. G]VFM99768.1 MAG: hypothetical protein BECKG1743E_GA0114224_102801 [Candidatus Kentron sp. G]VFN01004.1 MAG: hypothetical protein BECKG1743D_GA0114223_102421 [Candidatus Kentron sp. G]
MRSEARHYIPPNRVRYPTDCLFASGCSPPHLTVTQLPSASESWHTPVGDFHPADESPSRAHDRRVVLGKKGDRIEKDADYKSAIPDPIPIGWQQIRNITNTPTIPQSEPSSSIDFSDQHSVTGFWPWVVIDAAPSRFCMVTSTGSWDSSTRT